MPGWNIHLEAANRALKKLHFSPVEKKEFLVGCLLPDINNGYINQAKILKAHEETHYAFDKKSSLNFYAENQSKIDQKSPIFLGYLFHLFTDGYFNYDFYRTIKRDEKYQNLSRPEKRKIKHHDFWIYDTKFNHALNLTLKDSENLARVANTVPAVDISSDDLLNVDDILKSGKLSQSIKDKTYIFYTETRLDALLEEMINSFAKKYLGESYA